MSSPGVWSLVAAVAAVVALLALVLAVRAQRGVSSMQRRHRAVFLGDDAGPPRC